MKKLLFSLALVAQIAFVWAAPKTTGPNAVEKMKVAARYENVQMYRQPGTSTEILRALHSTDEIKYVRQHNKNWSIVVADGQVGYVLTTELGQAKIASPNTLAKK